MNTTEDNTVVVLINTSDCLIHAAGFDLVGAEKSFKAETFTDIDLREVNFETFQRLRGSRQGSCYTVYEVPDREQGWYADDASEAEEVGELLGYFVDES